MRIGADLEKPREPVVRSDARDHEEAEPEGEENPGLAAGVRHGGPP